MDSEDIACLIIRCYSEVEFLAARNVCKMWLIEYDKKCVIDKIPALIHRRQYLSAMKILLNPPKGYVIGAEKCLRAACSIPHIGLIKCVLKKFPKINVAKSVIILFHGEQTHENVRAMAVISELGYYIDSFNPILAVTYNVPTLLLHTPSNIILTCADELIKESIKLKHYRNIDIISTICIRNGKDNFITDVTFMCALMNYVPMAHVLKLGDRLLLEHGKKLFDVYNGDDLSTWNDVALKLLRSNTKLGVILKNKNKQYNVRQKIIDGKRLVIETRIKEHLSDYDVRFNLTDDEIFQLDLSKNWKLEQKSTDPVTGQLCDLAYVPKYSWKQVQTIIIYKIYNTD